MNTGKEIRQPMQGFMFALCYFHTPYTRMQKEGDNGNCWQIYLTLVS